MNPFIKGTMTLCGSGRFMDQFDDASYRLEVNGWKVFSISKNIKSSNLKTVVTPELKQNLDDLHKSKILDSQAIMIIDKDYYVGESTKSEIEYARSLGLRLFSYTDTLKMHPKFDALVYADLHNYQYWKVVDLAQQ